MIMNKDKIHQIFDVLASIACNDDDVRSRMLLTRNLGKGTTDPVAIKVLLEIEDMERKYNLAEQLCRSEHCDSYALRHLQLRTLVKEGCAIQPGFYDRLINGAVNSHVRDVLNLYYKPNT